MALPRSLAVSPLLWAAIFVVAILAPACSADDPLLGTELSAANPAPDFRLHDHFQRPVALSDLQGKVVALTFLYTSCPDICPVVTAHLRDAHGLLGEDAGGVAIVAVSVDPRRDTAERALEYSTRWQMEDKWAFLVGAEEDLAPIWASYYIAASADTGAEEHTQPSDLGPTAREGVDGYLVSHSAPIYLIDRNGRMRVLFTLPFEPESLVHDIRLLLGR